MNLSELTGEMNKFVEQQGWYAPGSKRPQTPRNLAISLALEAGEVLEHLQWGEIVTDKQAFAGELADVALYLLQLVQVTEIDLEEAIHNKLEINRSRTW